TEIVEITEITELVNQDISMDNTVTTTFSAPVVQSRLEHHHLQQQKQLLKSHKPETRHQRSKSINKGKRGSPHNQSKETSVPVVSVSANSKFTDTSFTNNNFNNYSGTIDDSHLSAFGDTNRPVQRRSSEKRPSRRHQRSDSIVTILKRPQSATDFVKSSNNNISISNSSKMFLDVTHEEQDYQQLSSAVGDYSKERRRSDASPSKSKCSQRQSDVNSTLLNPCLKSLSSFSPKIDPVCLPVPSQQTNNAFYFPPLNYSNAILALEEEMCSKHDDNEPSTTSDNNAHTKRPSSNKSYKRRSDIYLSTNVPFIPENAPRRQSSTAIELQSQVATFASQDCSMLSTTPPAYRRPSTSPDRIMASKLYAGPTFHNSPAPSDLPLPSFLSKPSSKESSPLMTSNTIAPALTPSRVPSPSLSSGNSSDDDMFVMDDVKSDTVKHSDQLYPMRKQESSEFLRILSERQYNPSAYMVPARMATSHNPTQVYPAQNGLSLTEISESLRTLLKIHGQ
ncbi:25109_t:CDS:2, partial [Gigaspora rosea]